MTDADMLAAFQAENPDVEIIEMVWPDMNGVMRGKWLPASEIGKLIKGDARIPASTYALDIFSEDADGPGLAAEQGDPDARTIPLMHTLRRVTWTERPTAQIMLRASGFDGEFPSPYSPRDALAAVAERYAAKGLTPVVAPELEFYLLDPEFDDTGRAQPPRGPGGARLSGGQVFLLDMQRHFAPVIEAIEEAAAGLGAPTSGVLVEFGPGQFETNLNHQADPLLAADQAVLLRRAIRGAAQAHGYEACFMAKPFGTEVGSGQHFHASVLDAAGENIFAGDDPAALNPALAGAIGGCLQYMPESTLGFAPHLNSYRRLRPNGFAPCTAAWGFDNRSVAVRSPASTGKAARLEHRVAGADANPYIAMALILSAMLDGMEAGENPGPALEGNATPEDGAALPASWSEAQTAFANSDFVKRALGAEFTRAYGIVKAQEMNSFAERVSDVEHQVTLRML